MTEADAKTKWCPLARALVTLDAPNGSPVDVSSCNRSNTTISLCIASACMAWRWSRAKEAAAYLRAVQERMKSTGENFNVATNKVYAEIGSTFDKTEGYCGAFGAES